MKQSLTRILFASFIMVFAISCGKDSGGSKGTDTTYNYSPYTGSNLSGTNLTSMTNIQAWYAAAEPSLGSTQRYGKVNTTITANTNTTNCPGEIKKVLFFTVCIVKNGGTPSSTNGTMSYFLVGLANGGDLNYPLFCPTDSTMAQCKSAESNYPGKAANANLQAALSGQNNSLTLISATQSGSVYTISYGSGVLSTTPTIIYKIDTSKHSMFNPVEITNLTNLTQEYVVF